MKNNNKVHSSASQWEACWLAIFQKKPPAQNLAPISISPLKIDSLKTFAN